MGSLSFTKYVVNIGAIRSNILRLKTMIGSGAKFCMMIKADAYGHGMREVGRRVADLVDCFGVATIEEGICLREEKIPNDILVMSPLNYEKLRLYSLYNLTASLGSVFEAGELSRRGESPIKVHFQVNSGLNRFGFSSKNEILHAKRVLMQNSNFCITGVYSHLATKENDVEFMQKQKNKFDEICEIFRSENIIIHLSNSNATIHHPEFSYDMVRCGFSCYGWVGEEFGFLPALSIVSKITSVRWCDVGESVGYDRTFVANRKMKVATVPLGYADGIDRRLSNKGWTFVGGKKANIVGNVCMDCFMIDVSDCDGEVGDDVLILGEDNVGNRLRLSDYAKLLGTSEYEVLLKFRRERMNAIYVE